MARQVALAVLLCEAGYDWSRADRMADIVDRWAPVGMSADDLFSALLRWRDMPRPLAKVYESRRAVDSPSGALTYEAWKFVAYWAPDDVTTHNQLVEAMIELSTIV